MDQDIADHEELAADTLERLREALAESDTPSLARIIEIVRQMSDKADVLSIQDLAEAIGHDLTTMVKVMKAANCLQFNPSALEVNTVARAVSVIGFNKIQILALSLLLIESAENKVNTVEGRDVSARALCGALLAEEASRKLSLGDAEAAFVCTALRSYGRLLLSTFLIDEYRQAVQLSEQMPADRAFRLTFGLTPLEVSQRILGEANLSGIGSSMFQPVPPTLLHCQNPGQEESLVLAADFGSGLADLVSRPDLTPAEYEKQSELWLDRFQVTLGIDQDDLKEIMEGVRERLDDFGRAQEVDVFSSSLFRRIKGIANGRNFNLGEDPPRRAKPSPAGAALVPARGPLAVAVKKVKATLAEDPSGVIQAFGIATAAIRKALRLDACVLFVRQEQGTRYHACAGEGGLFRQIENQPLIDPSSRDVFTVCLTQGEDVLIQDSAEARIAPFVPRWFHDALRGGPFLLLPLKDSGGVFAVICGVSARGQRIELGVTRLPQFRSLRSLLNQLRTTPAQPRAAA